jgi:ABC-type antimicrobial peptide transport system, permease component
MIKNYFKIAARHLAKQKMYSAIKIGGFALSIAACLLIALYIKEELSYDRYYPTTNRIYRITGEYDNNGKLETGADWPPPMAKALREDFPEVEKSGRLMPHPLFYCAGSNQVRTINNEQNTYDEGFTYADQDMLDILQLRMVYGDRAHALADPNSIVITKRKADKFFPNQNPVGKLIILNNDRTRIYKVGGVIEDFPATSHIRYDFWLTMTSYELWKGEQAGWSSSNYYTYVLLKPGTSPAKFQSKLKLILTKYYLPMMLQNGNKEAGQFIQKARLLAQPITDVHLYSYNIDDGLEKGDVRFVWLFGAIACFILIIACINFINLSTAKSANRAKEVGLRKVVGSHRIGLIKQFLTESLLFSVLSFLLGILIAALSLPYFNTLFAKSLRIPWMAWWLFPLMIAAAVIIGIIAGLYPSFYLSAFKPINVLKGQLSRGSKNSALRNGLVVFQFTTSIILIIGTIVIYKQTHYILNKKIGFNKNQVLLIQGTNTLESKTVSFKNELLKSADISGVSISDYLPVSGTKRDGNTFYREGRMKEDIGVGSQKWRVDYDYMKTMGMKITEGRNFSKVMASDSSATIINKTMAEKLGLKNPIGQRIVNGWETWTVIGVMEDFNFESMKQDVGPLCVVLGNNTSTIVAVKMNTANTKSVISYIHTTWNGFAPGQPLRYTFLDESFANMYSDVQRTGSIFTTFAVMAIIIACLGLFALSAFMAEQRNKEIGIRKALGASVSGITAMLSKDFVKLVMISIIIASPIAYWAMTKWLQHFAYRIAISWWMIAAAGLTAIIIALITISFQSIKAALMNPVKCLRTE